MYSSSALQRIQKDCLIYLIHQHGQQLISNRKPGEKSVFSSASQHDWKGFTSVMLFVACNFWQHTCLWLQWICSSMPPFGEEMRNHSKSHLIFCHSAMPRKPSLLDRSQWKYSAPSQMRLSPAQCQLLGVEEGKATGDLHRVWHPRCLV